MEPIRRDTHDIYPFISPTGRLAGAAKGKKVIITGGGKGIGKAIAQHFALAGASHIVITGRSQSALDSTKASIEAEAPSCTVACVATDLTYPEAAEPVFSALPAGAKPDILVNNAGVNSDARLAADTEPEDWWRDWEVNGKATYLMTRAFLRAADGGPGVVINVSTSVADMVVPNMSSYGASKLAVNRFTEMIQLEYGSQGIRCLCLHPGGILSTDMGQAAPEQFKGSLLDTVELAAGTVLYLSTREASYLDARMVFADWNMEKVEAIKDEIVQENLLVSRISYGTRLNKEIVGLPSQ